MTKLSIWWEYIALRWAPKDSSQRETKRHSRHKYATKYQHKFISILKRRKPVTLAFPAMATKITKYVKCIKKIENWDNLEFLSYFLSCFLFCFLFQFCFPFSFQLNFSFLFYYHFVFCSSFCSVQFSFFQNPSSRGPDSMRIPFLFPLKTSTAFPNIWSHPMIPSTPGERHDMLLHVNH